MLPERNHSASLAIMANNEGVIHLQRNEHRSAIASFKFAIQHLTGLVNAMDDSSDHCGTQRKQELFAIPRANPLQDELSFLFRQAVALRDDSVSSCQYCVEDIAAITYNLGFAYHILGLNESSRKLLNRGLSLYELALSLLVEAHRIDDSMAPSPPLLKVLLLNNIGHLQHTIGLDHDAHQTFAELLRTWSNVDKVGDFTRFLQSEDCVGLFFNLYMYSQKPKTAAAA
jgi:tetratricopeptide (TPR) repeat protein